MKLALIERYATVAVLPRVQALYVNELRWRSGLEARFLTYFLRTAPTYGSPLVEQVIQRDRSGSVLHDVAAIRVSPELRTLALAHIDDEDKPTVASALSVVARTGIDAVESQFWARLAAWHERWRRVDQDEIPYAEQNYQDTLVEGLPFGGGRCKRQTAIERLRALYIKGRSVDGNIEFPVWHSPIRIRTSDLWRETRFQIDFCGNAMTSDQAKAAIRQFPSGTRV